MNTVEIAEKSFELCRNCRPFDFSLSCDTSKCGNPERTVTKAVVCMVATTDLIRKAVDWGAEMIITHEPVFHDGFDRIDKNDPVTAAKVKLLKESGIVVWRLHDHMHLCQPDMIAEHLAVHLGLNGAMEWSEPRNVPRFRLNSPLTPLEIAEKMKQESFAEYIRLSGSTDHKCSLISLCCGQQGDNLYSELKDPEIDLVIAGEGCEWLHCEYARDAGMLGFHKALLFLGHIPSERDGMIYLSKQLQKNCPGVEIRYFECGESYLTI